MKKILSKQTYIFLFSLIVLSLTTAFSFGQDSAATSSTRSTTTTTEQTFIYQPWVWVVGGVVLLLLIIALTRRNKGGNGTHTDKVTYTKTTSSNDNA